jgi:hypothetical protein
MSSHKTKLFVVVQRMLIKGTPAEAGSKVRMSAREAKYLVASGQLRPFRRAVKSTRRTKPEDA